MRFANVICTLNEKESNANDCEFQISVVPDESSEPAVFSRFAETTTALTKQKLSMSENIKPIS